MGKTGEKLKMVETIPNVTIRQEKVKNPNQSMPITAKVKQSSNGSKLKN